MQYRISNGLESVLRIMYKGDRNKKKYIYFLFTRCIVTMFPRSQRELAFLSVVLRSTEYNTHYLIRDERKTML